jgi:hypothetical protein
VAVRERLCPDLDRLFGPGLGGPHPQLGFGNERRRDLLEFFSIRFGRVGPWGLGVPEGRSEGNGQRHAPRDAGSAASPPLFSRKKDDERGWLPALASSSTRLLAVYIDGQKVLTRWVGPDTALKSTAQSRHGTFLLVPVSCLGHQFSP